MLSLRASSRLLPQLLWQPAASLSLLAPRPAGSRPGQRPVLRKGMLSPEEKRSKQHAHLAEALELVRAYAIRGFDEGVSVDVQLNIDVKQTQERVRGVANLPHGQGKNVRVAVFARGEKADEARRAGAEVVGAEDLVKEVVEGRLDFERVIATPDMLAALAKAARVLGPKGLMPNPKRGTVVDDVTAVAHRVDTAPTESRNQA